MDHSCIEPGFLKGVCENSALMTEDGRGLLLQVSRSRLSLLARLQGVPISSHHQAWKQTERLVAFLVLCELFLTGAWGTERRKLECFLCVQVTYEFWQV